MQHTRVVCAVIGTLSVVFGIVEAVLCVIWAIESYQEAGDNLVLAFLVCSTMLLLVEGVLMFVLPARAEKARSSAGAASTSTHDGAPEQERDVAPGPKPEPRAKPQPESHTDDALSASEETARMFYRSNDVFATARDIVRTYSSNPNSARGRTFLATMLQTQRLEDWEDAPICEAALLKRTHSYWLRGNPEDLDVAGYDRFIAVEAALNMDLALPELAQEPCDSPRARKRVDAYLRDFVDQPVQTFDFAESLGRAYPGLAPDKTPGEWFVRAAMVNDAECVRLPFRLSYELRCNALAHVAALRLRIPRPVSFTIVSSDEVDRTLRARAYALRLAWLLSSHAFANVEALECVEVLCCESDESETLLALVFTRELVERLRPVVHGSDIDVRGFPRDEGIVVAFGHDGWFAPVTPPLDWDDEILAPQAWYVQPELDERLLTRRCAEITGAKRICDLGINENATRVNAAYELVSRWRDLDQRSCEAIVATIMDIRSATQNVSLAEACDRTVRALLEGSVDPADERAICDLIVSDGVLQTAVERASALFEEEHPDPEQVVAILREPLSPILDFGFYADDESCVYRYFGSVPERIAFNTLVDDHAHEVRLVPDSYYNALGLLASALNMLERSDEAMQVSDEMMRIAPVSVDACMRKVRSLENESRILEAAELIRERAVHAVTPRDAAFAHYRLAYMEWKLGREDLAVACYVRALTWNTPFSEQARKELDDLLEAYPQLKEPTPKEAVALLKREGIPVGFTEDQESLDLVAATLLVDEHALCSAMPLLSVVCSAEVDDVYVGIRRTLDED